MSVGGSPPLNATPIRVTMRLAVQGRAGSGHLRRGRALAGQRGAAHVALLVGGEGPAAMHGATVVPHHEVADAPLVRVDELALVACSLRSRRSRRASGTGQHTMLPA